MTAPRQAEPTGDLVSRNEVIAMLEAKIKKAETDSLYLSNPNYTEAYTDGLDEHLENLRALPAASQWRDMASAPKDGTCIDLWVGRRLVDCRWHCGIQEWINDKGIVYGATYYMMSPLAPLSAKEGTES